MVDESVTVIAQKLNRSTFRSVRVQLQGEYLILSGFLGSLREILSDLHGKSLPSTAVRIDLSAAPVYDMETLIRAIEKQETIFADKVKKVHQILPRKRIFPELGITVFLSAYPDPEYPQDPPAVFVTGERLEVIPLLGQYFKNPVWLEESAAISVYAEDMNVLAKMLIDLKA